MQVFVTNNYLAIVSEFVGDGDSVSDYLSSPGVRTPAHCRAFFQQLILAIEYCHSRVRSILETFSAFDQSEQPTDAPSPIVISVQSWAIRHLKTDALLLDFRADGSPVLKISYFGYAKHDDSVARTIATPLPFIAPEVLGYEEYDKQVRIGPLLLY